MNRRGFTIIELLVVLSIMSILAAFAMPRYHRYRQDAIAAQAVGDFKVVQSAAYTYNGETDRWPATSGIGVTPTDMVEFLPGGFSFDRGEYRMRWISFSGSFPTGSLDLLVLVYYPDSPELGAKIAHQLRKGYRVLGTGRVVFALMLYQFG